MDPRKQRTLDQLSNAFFDLLQEGGYSSLSVSELCERADVRRATFYKHFSSKEDFLLFLLRSFRKELLERVAINDVCIKSAREHCLILTTCLADFAAEKSDMLSRFRLDGEADALLLAFADAVAGELEADLDRFVPNDENGVVASFYAFGLLGVFKRNMDLSGTFDKELFLHEMFAVIDRFFS